jgi:hypothetical protein
MSTFSQSQDHMASFMEAVLHPSISSELCNHVWYPDSVRLLDQVYHTLVALLGSISHGCLQTRNANVPVRNRTFLHHTKTFVAIDRLGERTNDWVAFSTIRLSDAMRIPNIALID